MSAVAEPRLLGSRLRAAQWAAVGSVAAAALGLATAVNPMAGIGLAIMIGVAVATVLRPASILVILMLSVFVEIISVGGVTISRLIAPVALLVVLFELGRGGAKLRPGPQLFWAVAYSLLALASALWTVSASHTMYGIASLAIALTYMLCFGALLESEQQLRRLLYVLAVGSLVVGAWSLASFKGWTIGPSPEDSLQGGRAQGGVGDPNFFASSPAGRTAVDPGPRRRHEDSLAALPPRLHGSRCPGVDPQHAFQRRADRPVPRPPPHPVRSRACASSRLRGTRLW